MGRSRTNRPDETRIPLSDGDWVDVRKFLTAGEYRKLLTGQFKDQAVGEAQLIDHDKLGLTKLLAYILRWSFVDFNQKPIAYDGTDRGMPEADRVAALDNLDPDTYRELIGAIDTHEDHMEQELAAQKNGQSTSPEPVAT